MGAWIHFASFLRPEFGIVVSEFDNHKSAIIDNHLITRGNSWRAIFVGIPTIIRANLWHTKGTLAYYWSLIGTGRNAHSPNGY